MGHNGYANFYLTDQVDSVKLVTDNDGTAITRFEYLPYGESWFTEGKQKTAPKYNSQELDKETGYYYYNARHYDPEIARFVTADSIIDGVYSTQGWNRYSYVQGNPVRYSDPTGHVLRDGSNLEKKESKNPVDKMVDKALGGNTCKAPSKGPGDQRNRPENTPSIPKVTSAPIALPAPVVFGPAIPKVAPYVTGMGPVAALTAALVSAFPTTLNSDEQAELEKIRNAMGTSPSVPNSVPKEIDINDILGQGPYGPWGDGKDLDSVVGEPDNPWPDGPDPDDPIDCAKRVINSNRSFFKKVVGVIGCFTTTSSL